MSEINDLEQAFFILEHGSAEGVSKYLKAIKMIKEQCVQVVRCKDCRHRDPEDYKCDSGEMERQGCPFKVADDYFCAYGERRSE